MLSKCALCSGEIKLQKVEKIIRVVNDTVSITVNAEVCTESKSKVNGEVFNIGGGSRIYVKELIKLLESTGRFARYWKNCKSNLFG